MIKKRIVLISCGKKKLESRAKAADLYIGTLFRLSFQYAQRLKPEAMFILSGKYGLLDLDDVIEPYDLYLSKLSTKEKKAWASRALVQMQEKSDLKNDHFVILAGQCYREHLIPHLGSCEIPLEGLGFGEQLQHLKLILDSHE